MTPNDIAARLEAGETGREIDEAVFLLFNPEPSGNGWKKTSIGNWHKFVNDQGRWTENVHAEPVSTSLDAAVALVEKGQNVIAWTVGNCIGGPTASVTAMRETDAHEYTAQLFGDGKPAAALVAALLKAGV